MPRDLRSVMFRVDGNAATSIAAHSTAWGLASLAGRTWLRRLVRIAWRGVREWCGDAAYECYLKSRARAGAQQTLTAEQFYVEQLNRRYSRPNRCC
jgi:uncharacterized short protein YbdD (DUF466 family)